MDTKGMKMLRVGVAAALLLVPAIALAARQLPVDGGTITSGIGWRLDPFCSGRLVYHNGIDIAVPVGTPVHPTRAGTVYFAGPYRGYGNLVAIDHGNGYISLYGHNSAIKVRVGDRVDTRTVIALSGSTGRSTGPHVHYEVRILPGYEKEQKAQLEERMKAMVEKNINRWVEEQANGKGGPDMTVIVPDGLEE